MSMERSELLLEVFRANEQTKKKTTMEK